MLVQLCLPSVLLLWTVVSGKDETKADLLAKKDVVGLMAQDVIEKINKERFEEKNVKGDFVAVKVKQDKENVVKEIIKDTIEQMSEKMKSENRDKNQPQGKNQHQGNDKHEGKKSKSNELEIPEDTDHPEQMATFSGLIKERRKIQRRMLFHIVSSFLVGTLTYFLRSNPLLMYLFGFLDDKNENWGQNIEERWVDHQEKMADFVLSVMHKYAIDAKAAKGKKIHLEVDHSKYVPVPVYRTFPNDPLPEHAIEINNNRVNLWKNLFTRR